MGVTGRTGHRRRNVLLIAGGVLAGVAVFVLLYFEPQDLFIDKTVNESLPFAIATASAPTTAAAPHAQAVLLASGGFRSGEHHTTGTAQLLRLPDGTRLLRLVRLRTSN